jgi:putative membrane-bound dehydrogenase-like protein
MAARILSRRISVVVPAWLAAGLLLQLVPAGAWRATADVPGIRLDPRLEISRWVAEPDVVDPVGLAFDAAGVAYVAECRDYPSGAGPGGATQSSVRRLEDVDGDGRPERVTQFAIGLSYVTSVLPWRDGLLVLAPPQILFLRDTDGDGRADSREVLIEGLTRGVSDSLANNLRYHLDGRVHVANGGNGGRLVSRRRPGDAVNIEGSDFAFDPDTGEIWVTAQTGGGFGLVSDEWGRWFTTYNINHIQHRFLSRPAALRNGAFPNIPITGGISDHGDMAEIFPISVPATRPNHPEQAGHFSAAGGMGVCLSSAFPEDLQASVFVGDVVGNLVHRDVIVREGPVFRATRAPEESASEFLASSDPAFRPVALEAGPDGALYLADMQRDVIEHPDYLPAKVRETMNLRAGDDRGRLYRITPKGGLRPVQSRLDRMTPAELVERLGHPDQWWRLNAQRLLQERKPASAIPLLKDMASTDGRPLARLHALWTLRAMGALAVKDVARGLTDGHPGVRENCLQIAESLLPEASDLHPLVVRLAQDADPRVRFQAAQTLGFVGTDLASGTLRELYRNDAESAWSRRAALTSMQPSTPRLFLMRFLLESGFRFGASPGRIQILRELGEMMAVNAAGRADDLFWLLDHVDATLAVEARVAVLQGVEAGLARSAPRIRLPESTRGHLARLASGGSPNELIAAWRLLVRFGVVPGVAFERAVSAAARGALDPARPVAARVGDISVLEVGSPAQVAVPLSDLLGDSQLPDIQTAAFDVLQRVNPADLGSILVRQWPSLWPGVRGRAAALLAERKDLHEALMGAVETGTIRPGELNLDLEQRRRLLRSAAPPIRERAAKFWSDEEYSNRKAIVADLLGKVPAHGDASRGRKVFEEACSRCHKAGGAGMNVGPDLAGSAHRSVEDLLSNILDPNMAMNPAFVAYAVEQTEGETVVGLLAGQNPDSVVLVQASEQRVVIPRAKVKSIRSTGQSLMPEGLESGRSPQDLRDLIAFIRGER